MTPFEIPTVPSIPQRFTITLSGVDYVFQLKWNVANQTWILDIFASDGTTALAAGIPLVTGTDLLSQFSYLDIGGKLVAQTDHDLDLPPAFDTLGDTAHLYYVTD